MRPSVPVRILEYVDPVGRSPFGRWFDRLDAGAAARVTAALTRLAQGSWLQVKSAGGGLHELRVDVGPGYRIYFGTEGSSMVILLAAGDKSGQQSDIVRAKELWQALKRRRRQGEVRWH